MANRTIELTLKANTQGLISGVKTAQRAASNAGRDLDNFRRQNEQAWNTVGTTLATAGAAVTAGVGLAVNAAMDWESAWAGVQKTNEGTEQQMATLEEDLRNLANTLPATHTEIAAVAEAAGQLGVGVEDVSEFTETMINLGETTNLSAEEAATALARFSNITGTSFSDVDKLGSVVVDLGNNFATTESEILAMSERVAAAGTQAGLTDGEIMGLATAMSSVGIEAQAGGTAMTQTFNEIDTAVRDGGESLEGWAELAGVSAQEFSDAWQEDPATAITMMIEGLGEVASQGGDVNGTLEDLGIQGIRQADTLRRLAGASDLVGESLKVGNAAFEENSALAEEAALRYETVEAKISVAWNNIKDAAITAGETILPVVGDVADIVGDLASGFSDLPPAVSGGITAISGVAGVSSLALGGLMLLVPKAVETYEAFNKIATAGPKARGAIKKVGATAGIAGASLAVLMIADNLTDSFNDAAGTAQGFDTELRLLADSSKRSGAGMDALFAARDYSSLGILPTGINDLNSAINALETRAFMEFLEEGATLYGLFGDTAQDLALEGLGQLDEAMASMTQSGDLDEAAVGFRKFAEATDEAGWSTERAANATPEYMEALKAMAAEQGVALEGAELYEAALGNLPPELQEVKDAADRASKQEELKGALEDVGVAADGTVESLTDYLDILFETGLAEQSAMQAQASYQESLDGVSAAIEQITDEESGLGGMAKVLNESKDGFDLSTEAGRLAQGAFLDVSQSGMDMASAMADAGASQDEIQTSLEGTYEDLISAGEQFGLTGEQAEALARSVLGIDDDVSIETWMSEEAKETADNTAASIFELPGDVDIDTFMSDAAYRKSVLTKAGIDNIPDSDRVSSYMEDDAFIEALNTRAAVLDIPPEAVVSSFMSSAARDEADSTTAEILGIPEGASISSWMSSDARAEAQSTNDWLNIIDGKRTSSTHTHNEITRLQTLRISSPGDGPGPWAPGGATGGRVGRDFGFPRLANGGRLPYTGLGTDQILGLSSGGRPTALVDDGEWVIRERSADKYNSVLDRINADHPSVQHLAGYADGGRAASSAVAAANSSPGIDYGQLAAAMAGAGGSGGVSIGEITAVGGDTQQVVNRVGDEIFRRLRQEGVQVGSF